MNQKTGMYWIEPDTRFPCYTFVPYSLLREGVVSADDELYSLLIKAHRLLGTLNAMLLYLSDIDKFNSFLIKFEAELSCGLMERNIPYPVFWRSIEQSKSTDKIMPYIKAAQAVNNAAFKTPTLMDMIKIAHKTMMSEEKPDEAGKLRDKQLILQKVFSSSFIEFNPPNPNEMTTALNDLVKYFSDECEYDALIKIALIYYQLLTIYPFTEGNGRICRIIANQLFVEKLLIPQPFLCLSYYISLNESEYHKAIEQVRNNHNGYMPWIRFFVKAVVIAAEKSIDILTRLQKLRDSDLMKIKLLEKPSPVVLRVYEQIWKTPIIETRHIAADLELSYNTVVKAVDTLLSLNILRQIGEKKRYRRYAYTDLLEIFKHI